MWGLIAIVAVTAIAAAAFLSRPHKTTVGELEAYRADIGPELAGFIRTVNQVNDTEDPEYANALKALVASKQQVLTDSARMLAEGSDAPFAIRHSTLLALAALRDPEALDLLSQVALNPQPLPPKDSRQQPSFDLHGGGALEAGTILALDALEGIEALADDGNAQALDALVKAAAVQSNAIRGVALTALAAKPERSEHLTQAMAQLPRELRHLSELRRTSVEEVPQVDDPRIHLAGREAGGPAAPDTREERPDGERDIAPEHGAPRVGRR